MIGSSESLGDLRVFMFVVAVFLSTQAMAFGRGEPGDGVSPGAGGGGHSGSFGASMNIGGNFSVNLSLGAGSNSNAVGVGDVSVDPSTVCDAGGCEEVLVTASRVAPYVMPVWGAALALDQFSTYVGTIQVPTGVRISNDQASRDKEKCEAGGGTFNRNKLVAVGGFGGYQTVPHCSLPLDAKICRVAVGGAAASLLAMEAASICSRSPLAVGGCTVAALAAVESCSDQAWKFPGIQNHEWCVLWFVISRG